MADEEMIRNTNMGNLLQWCNDPKEALTRVLGIVHGCNFDSTDIEKCFKCYKGASRIIDFYVSDILSNLEKEK